MTYPYDFYAEAQKHIKQISSVYMHFVGSFFVLCNMLFHSTPANCILLGQPATATPLPTPLILPSWETTPALYHIYSISQLMAQHVNTE